MHIAFLKRLREERRFASLEELKTQITQDIAATRTYFGL